jgi:hypothetical protein
MAQGVVWCAIALSLVSLLAPLPADAAFGVGDIVYDPTVWAEAFTTAVNTTAMAQNQLKDLASLSNLSEFGNLIVSTQRLLLHVQRIAGRLKGRNGQWVSLTDMNRFREMDPQDLSDALEMFNQESSGLMGMCANEAMEAQELLEEIGSALQDTSTFVSAIAAIAGTVQGLQRLAGTMALAASEVMRMQVLAGTFHQAMLNDKLVISVNEQVSGLLARERLKDWPMEPLTAPGG